MCYDLPVLRSVRYRQAAIAFVFTSLWFVLGFLLLWSPLPRALGIHSMMLAAWLLFFFVLLAIDGVVLMLASLNSAFPPSGRRRARYAGAAAAPPPRRAARARSRSRATERPMAVATLNGIDIWYELTEPPARDNAPLLVLTHGYGGPHWPPVIAEIRARYRLLYYHVRGHGQSSAPEDAAGYTVPQFAADLAALLDAIGVERAHIGGVSMGGMISAQFACDYPERVQSLALCDTTCGNDTGGAGEDDAAAAADRQVRDAFDQLTRIAEKHGLEELTRRENRHRREHDAYARTRPQSDEEQDAEAARKITEMTVGRLRERRPRAA